MLTLSAFLTSTAGVFCVNVITSFLKRYVMPRWGVNGVHIVVFILSFAASALIQYKLLNGMLPDLSTLSGIEHFMTLVGTVFAASITAYEVLLKRFGFQ